MRRKLFIFFILALAVIPSAAFALVQQDPSALLSGSGGGLVPQCEGAFCRACDLIELSSNVINFAIAFSVIIAALMFAYAGILYVTAASKPDQVKKAHGVFVNVFVGLCIVLTAWLLVNVTFSVLTGRGLAIWTDIACVDRPTSGAFPDAPGAPTPRPRVTPGGAAGGTPITSAGPTLTNAEAVRRLEAAGVCGGSTGKPCLAPGVRASGSRASLEGVHPALIDQAIIMHNACRCAFTVTSGTDGQHSTRGPYTHGLGWKLDIQHSNNPALQAFIRNRGGPIEFSYRSADWDGAGSGTYPASVYKDGCGNVYAMEPNILDLQVRGAACSY